LHGCTDPTGSLHIIPLATSSVRRLAPRPSPAPACSARAGAFAAMSTAHGTRSRARSVWTHWPSAPPSSLAASGGRRSARRSSPSCSSHSLRRSSPGLRPTHEHPPRVRRRRGHYHRRPASGLLESVGRYVMLAACLIRRASQPHLQRDRPLPSAGLMGLFSRHVRRLLFRRVRLGHLARRLEFGGLSSRQRCTGARRSWLQTGPLSQGETPLPLIVPRDTRDPVTQGVTPAHSDHLAARDVYPEVVSAHSTIIPGCWATW
jgi:hypothetical protein